MLWSCACVIPLLTLYLMGNMGPMSGVLHALPDDACSFNLTLRNFQPILSWEVKNRSIVPTHYTLSYTYMSKGEDMKTVPSCTNITRPSCDLTHEWGSTAEMYVTRVVGLRGDTELVSCSGTIFPDTDMSLEPPDFQIVGFVDHINVMLKFPPTLPKVPDEEGLWRYLSLVIEEVSGGIVKQHNLKINENTVGDFTYVINKLIPNTNYCVSVYFEPMDLRTINRSPLKCTHLQPEQGSESSESAKIGKLMMTVFLLSAVCISAGVALKRIGYICLQSKLPTVLKFDNSPAWVGLVLPPLEAVAMLEVIHVNRKKKVWDYNYDDESDSDTEVVPRASVGGYTMHGLKVRPLCPTSTSSSATLEDGSDPGAQDAELPEPEPPAPEAESQALMAAGPWECARGACEVGGAGLGDPFPEEDSNSTENSGDRIFFNVDLNSVFVRVLDDDDSEVPPVFALPEETADSEEPHEMEPGFPWTRGEGTRPCLPCPPAEGLQPPDAPFDKSDTSKLGGDGYIMR
ncbi:interferon alpha/beta receptor 2 [Molossus molossus]|uniref:Interferon alpha/beta receptor 2 n=1 Tax=Molossus molossus TaxID=27622 RepID=A0A7J8I095_MOLMO|nr:interferon alpha/beta receptor 2 [Molossus molossus]KAF6477688.1 interferon alpha and beta receptor subunit 2 [Molossus molossus]